MLDRREFLQIGSVGALSLAAGAGSAGGNGPRFGRNYAPHLGLFRHHAGADPLEQIRFLAGEGFRSLEDTGLRAKPLALQRQMGRELTRRGLSLACFTGVADFGRPTFASGRPDLRQAVLRDLRLAIEAADRVGARQLSIVPGKRDAALNARTQRQHAIELLHSCADVCELREVTLLLEPIEYGPGHSRLFLRSARDAAALCRSVGRSSCRVLIDVYQQAVVGEDVPCLLADVSDVLGHVQLGDYPGRKEPGSGELDFRKILATLDVVGYRGALGMEHGTTLAGRTGERAVIDAYCALDRLAPPTLA